MTAQTRSVLYTYFETGDKPTQNQFQDLIDSSLNVTDTSSQAINSDVAMLGNASVSGNFAVGGNFTINGSFDIPQNLNVSGAATLGSLTVAGQTNLVNTAVVGTVSAVDIYGVSFRASNFVNTPFISFSTNQGIIGTTTDDDAAVGSVGEYIEASAADGTISMTANTAKTVAYIALSPGDFDVYGNISFTPEASTTISQILGGISVSADTMPMNTADIFSLNTTFQTGAELVNQAPPLRVHVSASANYYLIAQCNFAVSGLSTGGRIWARRRR